MNASDSLKATASKIRTWVPSWHLDRFDIEMMSYVELVAERPELARVAAGEMWERTQRLQRKPEIPLGVPMLARPPEEAIDDWLGRCFDAGGYVVMPPLPRGW